mgnify:CR=1 FL=1
MDFIVIILALIAVVAVLKIIKSAVKFVISAGIILFLLYYLDLQGIIDLTPVLNALGI